MSPVSVQLSVTFLRHDAVMSNSFAHFTTLAKPRTVSGGMRTALHLPIRRGILLALLCISLVTASLGAYAVRNIVALGNLTDQAIDDALMSIGHARSASAGFVALKAAVARHRAFPDQAELPLRISALSTMLDENLAAITQGASTPQAAQAAAVASTAIADWRAAGGLTDAGPNDGVRLDALAQVANRRLERLIDHAARDGLEFQERIQAKVADAKFQTLLWTCAALILGGMTAMLLARRIVGFVVSISAAACRLAAEYAETKSSKVGANGSGALLTTIGTMRDNTCCRHLEPNQECDTAQASRSHQRSICDGWHR